MSRDVDLSSLTGILEVLHICHVMLLFLCLSAVCYVELRSYGPDAPMHDRIAYIQANGVQRDFTASDRGINIGILQWNGVGCEVVDVRNYDTYSDGPANGLSDWLYSLETGTMVVAVTALEAMEGLGAAIDALDAIGIHPYNLVYRAPMAFLAYVGAPKDAQLLIDVSGGPAILSMQLTCELSKIVVLQ